MELCHLALRSAEQREGLVYITNALSMLKIATLPGIGCLGYGMQERMQLNTCRC